MSEYERLIDEIYEGAQKYTEEDLKAYIDFLVQRGLLAKKDDLYTATYAFRQMIYRHTVAAIRWSVERLKKGKKYSLEELLTFISLRVALELLTGKMPPVSENDLRFVSKKEVGKLARSIYTFFVAGREKEVETIRKELEKFYEEVKNEA